MSNLIVNKLSILNANSRTAKIVDFYKGINVITSSKHSGGNYVGKSSILRSIFHTLGADGKFAQLWESEGDYIYMLDFEYNNSNYTMLRKTNYFKLFEVNRGLLFSTANRDDLAKKLSEIFIQKIYLKSHSGEYKLSQPVFNYILNFIEQTSIELCKFENFNGLRAFQSTYDDIIYSHLGVNSVRLNELISELDKVKKDISKRNERSLLLENMLNEIKANKNIDSVDINVDTLKKELHIHEEKYSKIVKSTSKYKKKLYESYEIKNKLENNIIELKSYISDNNSSNKNVLKEHVCPTCQSHLEDTSYVYFDNGNKIENFSFQILDTEKELTEIERTISLTMEKYQKELDDIKNLEYRIFESEQSIDDKLASIGVRRIKTNLLDELMTTNNEITQINIRKRSLNKEMNEIKKKRKEVDKFYAIAINDMILKYSLGGLGEIQIDKANTRFSVDGTRVNLASVLWLNALLKTKYIYNSESTVFPLVFDNPNNADFDDENNQKIFTAIFDNLPENGQIITSCVGFNIEDYPEHEIGNVNILNNPQNKLLNTEDFDNVLLKYNLLITPPPIKIK